MLLYPFSLIPPKRNNLNLLTLLYFVLIPRRQMRTQMRVIQNKLIRSITFRVFPALHIWVSRFPSYNLSPFLRLLFLLLSRTSSRRTRLNRHITILNPKSINTFTSSLKSSTLRYTAFMVLSFLPSMWIMPILPYTSNCLYAYIMGRCIKIGTKMLSTNKCPRLY